MKVKIEGVTKTFGSTKAVEDVSLDIEPGEIIAVLGPNGAGKTTLLRCMAGLMRPNSGDIFYDGERFLRGRLDLRKRLFFLPDWPVAFPSYTVIDHVAMVLKLYGIDDDGVEDKVVQLLKDFDLLTLCGSALAALSRGQYYKACLIAMVTVDPELWLIDEPFASGMDPHGITMFRRCVQDAAERGRTIVYSTQILAVAENFCSRFCLLDKGCVRLVGDVERLRQREAGSESILEDLFEKLREGAS